MWTKIKDFFNTDLGEIILHCVIAAVLALLADWYFDDWREFVATIVIILGFIVRELAQHQWTFSEMGVQSWKEWIYPAIVAIIIYAV